MKPVFEMKGGEGTEIKDMAMLCANCHRMIYRIRLWISDKKDLQKILNIADYSAVQGGEHRSNRRKTGLVL